MVLTESAFGAVNWGNTGIPQACQEQLTLFNAIQFSSVKLITLPRYEVPDPAGKMKRWGTHSKLPPAGPVQATWL